jgi:L-rhamnose isomerase
VEFLKELEENGRYFQRLALLEELKSMPWGIIWDQCCGKYKIPVGLEWIEKVKRYEEETLSKRL